MSKTQILKIKGDWQEVVDDCRATVGKEGLGRDPTSKFKRSILMAEHSPIRDIIFKWRWPDMPHWVTVHWVRHKWEKFVRTQRRDRVGPGVYAGERGKLPQDQPQTFTGEANTQHLIDTMRKRLCFQASPETREYAEDLKREIYLLEPEISDIFVPNCIYRCGCPEMTPCGYFERLCQMDSRVASTSLQERYDAYNHIFKEETNNA